MARSGKSARRIVKEKELIQISDSSAIEDIVSTVVDDNPAEVQAYRNGKTKLLGFFVGQVMKATRGKANPKLVNDTLKRKLEK
jgi:aspartyl-tRNA(Asn)/glutamyl-tRNA(Gln) amidotransferase subunit B